MSESDEIQKTPTYKDQQFLLKKKDHKCIIFDPLWTKIKNMRINSLFFQFYNISSIGMWRKETRAGEFYISQAVAPLLTEDNIFFLKV